MTKFAALFRRRISIHAPRTGSDAYYDSLDAAENKISIHAPRTGSDRDCKTMRGIRDDFNPRSPHGERPRSIEADGKREE